MYINKLSDIVNEYSNTCYRTIKMKLVSVKSSTNSDFTAEKNDKDPKLKFADCLRISKYKYIFAKC